MRANTTLKYRRTIRTVAAVVAVVFVSATISPNLHAATYERNLEASFPVVSSGKPPKLIIQADRGSIKVSTDSADKVQIRVFREIKSGTKAQADEVFANHEVQFLQDEKTVSD